MMDNPKGIHLLIDLYDCESVELLNDIQGIETILEECVKITGVTCLGKLRHQFKPNGITVIFLLEESHVSIHSWPSQGYASMDYYTCGSADPTKILDYITEKFKPGKMKYQVITRGILYQVCSKIIKQRKVEEEQRIGNIYGVVDQDGKFYIGGKHDSSKTITRNGILDTRIRDSPRNCLFFNTWDLFELLYKFRIYPPVIPNLPSMDEMKQVVFARRPKSDITLLDDDQIKFYYGWIHSRTLHRDICAIIRSFLQKHNKIKQGLMNNYRLQII